MSYLNISNSLNEACPVNGEVREGLVMGAYVAGVEGRPSSTPDLK